MFQNKIKTNEDFFFTVLFLLTSQLFFAQAIEPLPSDTSLIELNADISNQWEEFRLSADLKNTTPDTLLMVWRKDMSECPPEWKTIIGDPNQHYLHTVISNYDPTLGVDQPVTILPNQISQYGFHVELYPTMVAGCCTIPVDFSLYEKPDSIISTAYFRFAINDPSCDFVNDVEVTENKISVFPNPANETVFIEPDNPLLKIEVFDMNGKKLKTELNTNQINIDNLPNGILIFKMELENGQLFFQKINKI